MRENIESNKCPPKVAKTKAALILPKIYIKLAFHHMEETPGWIIFL